MNMKKMAILVLVGLVLVVLFAGTANGSAHKQDNSIERRAAMIAAWKVVMFNDDLSKAAKSTGAKDAFVMEFVLIFSQQEMIKGKSTAQKITKNYDLRGIQKVKHTPKHLERHIKDAAMKYGVPEELIKVVAKEESNFKHNAVSPKGAMGVMQIMPGTAKDLGLKNPFDPRENTMAGAKHLRYLFKRYEKRVDKADLVALVLYAYNNGEGNADKRLRKGFDVYGSKYVRLFYPLGRTENRALALNK
jgi:soluble lytic murein transglycosylase-like protein